MQCTSPLQAYQCSDGSVVFVERLGDTVRSLLLPCGQCVGCRLERSRQWAVRCMHEAQLYECNCYVTLTYERNPVSLCYRDFQLFMKRLRKIAPGVRFFMCGEYGEEHGRPHFHACLFGFDFVDKRYHCVNHRGDKLYRSELLERLWPHGFSTVGSVTFESAAYVARYVMKKVTGVPALVHYRVLDVETGEVTTKVPEFCHMSLKPGIGARWFLKYAADVYPHGKVVVGGVETKPPRYYDRMFKRLSPEAFELLSLERERLARAKFADNTPERLEVKRQVLESKVTFLKRGL